MDLCLLLAWEKRTDLDFAQCILVLIYVTALEWTGAETTGNPNIVYLPNLLPTLVNVYVDLVVSTRIAGTS